MFKILCQNTSVLNKKLNCLKNNNNKKTFVNHLVKYLYYVSAFAY